MKKAFETRQGPKEWCRNRICTLAKEHLPKVSKIFTLPSKEALCYTTFKKSFPKASVVCIERDRDICKQLWLKDIDATHTTISEYAEERKRSEKHHDVCFLDYYSFLSEKVIKEIDVFTSNDNILHPEEESIIAITLMKGMRVGKTKTMKFVADHTYKSNIYEVDNNLETTGNALHVFLATKFNNVDLLEKLEYSAEEGKSTKMYFYVFKIRK
jgi:hypothetical protein